MRNVPIGVETSENWSASVIVRAGEFVLISVSSRTHALEPFGPDPEIRRPFGEGPVLQENDPAQRARQTVEAEDRFRGVVEEGAAEGFQRSLAHAAPHLV